MSFGRNFGTTAATAYDQGSRARFANCDPNWEGPLFLVGMPRSGTKLLRSLLTRHERIRIPAIETEFLPFLADWVAHNGPADDETSFNRLFSALQRAPYFDYRTVVPPAFTWQEWREACREQFDLRGLFEGFIRYETGAVPGSGVIWGDKSPSYVRHINLLLATFPEARVVHIIRDVRDFTVSMRKAWGKDVGRAAFRWGTDVLMAHDLCARNPERCVEVHYEALIAAADDEMARLCGFLGIDFNSALTQLERPTENLGDAKGKTGIIRDNTRKYRRELSRRELKLVESLAWEAMSAVGYRPEVAKGQRNPWPLSMALRKLKDGANLVLRDVEARGFRRSALFYLSHQRFSRGSS